MSDDRFVTVMGARIRYRTEGRGPNLLLLHGLGASLETWDWTVPALRGRYTTIAPDFPGFGGSEALAAGPTVDGAARVVLAFMDAVGWQKTALIGSSLGGSIATLAAGTAPDRFTAVVLAAPGGFDAGVSPLLRLMTIRPIGEGLVMLAGPAPRFAIRNTFADRRRIPDALVDVVRRNAKRRSTGTAYLRALRAAVALGGVKLDQIYAVRQAAARITAPTLVVWGDRDRVIPRDQGAVAAQTIPGARLLVIRGAGHVPFIEDPAAFNDAVSAFLADAVRPPEAGSPR